MATMEAFRNALPWQWVAQEGRVVLDRDGHGYQLYLQPWDRKRRITCLGQYRHVPVECWAAAHEGIHALTPLLPGPLHPPAFSREAVIAMLQQGECFYHDRFIADVPTGLILGTTYDDPYQPRRIYFACLQPYPGESWDRHARTWRTSMPFYGGQAIDAWFMALDDPATVVAMMLLRRLQ